MAVKKLTQTVFVGLSGGVDSSVSASLLKAAGYNVRGVFIKVWQPDFLPCTWREDRLDAMRVCAILDIPFETLDLEDVYRASVVDYLVKEYEAGRTPNPDVMCNKEVKFGAFLSWAKQKGADFVATGHYAQNRLNTETGLYELHCSVDAEKDQSYFLWTLTQQELKHILFPVGHLRKERVRSLAHSFGLPTAAKKDSQGLCFLGKLDMKAFLKHFLHTEPGDVLTVEGKRIGTHEGALLYTLGQRHGFTLRGSHDQRPHYVVDKDLKRNTITVSTKEVAERSASSESVTLEHVNWVSGKPQEGKHSARVRYRQPLLPCNIDADKNGNTEIRFLGNAPLAPLGQSLVIYETRKKEILCRGGGIIA